MIIFSIPASDIEAIRPMWRFHHLYDLGAVGVVCLQFADWTEMCRILHRGIHCDQGAR